MKERSDRIGKRTLVVLIAGLCAFGQPLGAADLDPRTVQQFDRYVQRVETAIGGQLGGHETFLWIDRLPVDRRAVAQNELRAGKVVIERLDANAPDGSSDPTQPVRVPDGFIHHWIGTVFIAGATLAETLAFEQDYDHHQEYFRPDVIESKILRRDGNNFTIRLRLSKKKVITTVLDTEQEVHYEILDQTHAWSRSRATRIQEVDNAGGADERLEPMGHDHGFLWRLNTYWRFEEKDGGTYVECQTISLTRDIPAGLGWLIGPYLTSVPRESLTFTLITTENAVRKRIAS
ncbi:MAG TPA: hypothetical protein VEJ45_10060 [Candidatus Acidoferrales bacterium]|nr:hypothetical protein [Candidatus Acidoferrales bacterium]